MHTGIQHWALKMPDVWGNWAGVVSLLISGVLLCRSTSGDRTPPQPRLTACAVTRAMFLLRTCPAAGLFARSRLRLLQNPLLSILFTQPPLSFYTSLLFHLLPIFAIQPHIPSNLCSHYQTEGIPILPHHKVSRYHIHGNPFAHS